MSKNEYVNLPTEIIHDLAAELKAHKDALAEIQKMAENLSGRIKAECESIENFLEELD